MFDHHVFIDGLNNPVIQAFLYAFGGLNILKAGSDCHRRFLHSVAEKLQHATLYVSGSHFLIIIGNISLDLT
jgi:hypothetical protein